MRAFLFIIMKQIISYFQSSFGSLYVLLILALYISVFLSPDFGAADKVVVHWLAISIINFIALSHIIIKYDYFKIYIGLVFNNILFKTISVFWVLCLVSFACAYNIVEASVAFFQLTTFIFQILFISIFLIAYNIKILNIFYLILFFFLFQIYYSLSTYIDIINVSVYDFSLSSLLKGVGANRNITAAIFVIQIPFLITLILRSSNFFRNIVFSILIFSASYLIIALSSRASYISLTLILVSYIFFYAYGFKFRDLSFLLKKLFFTLLPIFASYFIFNTTDFNRSESNVIDRVSTINIDDESTSTRLRFYKQTFDYVINNPLKPMGIGNWKITSLVGDRMNIQGYTVPYQVHNDFLQVAAEIGIIGFFTYLLIFLLAFYYLFKLFFKSKSFKEKAFYFAIFISLLCYVIDANLNFPIARAIQQNFFVFLISLIIYKTTHEFKVSK